MTASLLPNGKQQFFDSNAVPLSGGSVYFYVPSTSTPKSTWQDAGETILNTNPITLDSAGEAIIYGQGQYRQLVKDSLGNTIWDQLTSSNLAAVNNLSDVSSAATALANLGGTTIQAVYPVGSLYFNVSSSTNPATLLGFGTWTAFAAGQVLIGVGSFTDGDGTSKTVTIGQQLGEYLHTLTTGEMPAHSHTDTGHTHLVPVSGTTGGSNGFAQGNGPYNTLSTVSGNANIQNTGGGTAHNNIQPSIAVYIWQRTA